VRAGDRVVRDPREPVPDGIPVRLDRPAPPPLPPPLRLVHEDDDLVVVDKPPGLLTIATARERERTVHRLLRAWLAARRRPERPFVVHRLDRETSGLLVFAKSEAARARLQTQFATRAAGRVYLAVVEGLVREDRGTLESVLVEDRSLRVRSVPRPVRRPAGGRARPAITHYRVLERRRAATLVELALGSGRRHQLRAQLAALGHPVAGDRDHGARTDPLRRLCLHATRLELVHPDTGAPVRFTSSPPAAFARVGR
jgi:23S rRNA pseudouridine1911/1915/1917 synthase